MASFSERKNSGADLSRHHRGLPVHRRARIQLGGRHVLGIAIDNADRAVIRRAARAGR